MSGEPEIAQPDEIPVLALDARKCVLVGLIQSEEFAYDRTLGCLLGVAVDEVMPRHAMHMEHWMLCLRIGPERKNLK